MILNKIRKTIYDHDLVREGDRILIGLSGGADSVCLVHALSSLSRELGITLFTAHINHGIRGEEARRDEEFAKAFSKSLGIECFTLHADVPRVAGENGISEEAAGRNVRYAFFEKLCVTHGIDKIATAHNRNDNAETILMNFMRGAVRGLGGIPYRRGRIVRPLLDVRRDEIEQYCSQNKLTYMTDSTNKSLEYTRNKIRHRLLPMIKEEFNGGFIQTVTGNAVIIREDGAYIEKQARRAYERIVRDSGAGIDELGSEDAAIRRRVIRMMIIDARGSADDIPSSYVNDILSLLQKNSGASVNLTDGITARIEYGRLIIENENNTAKPFEYKYRCPMTGIIPEINMSVTVSKSCERKTDGAIYLSCGENCEITIRSRHKGDKFYPSGMSGSKKVKELLINEKVPRGRRNAVPVVEIDGRIAAVGKRVDRGFLFKDKGIRIEFKPIQEVKD